jgi:hexosaminidase
MSWRGIEGGVAAAKAGHDVVMSPTSHAYFDYLQSRVASMEPKGIGGYVPMRKVYDFDPVPPALKGAEIKRVLGGQANLWSEFIPHPKHLEYMAYPRLCAMAEVLWSPKSGRDYDEFLKRLTPHLVRLDRLDVNYRPLTADPKAAARWKSGETTDEFQTKEWDVTATLSSPGNYDVLFSFTGGGNRLDIAWIEILENGETLQRVEHNGQTGTVNKDNTYRVSLPSLRTDATYTLRASVRSDGGTDSNGDIYFLKK